MANGKLTLGKQSGGKLSLVFPDGVSDTEVVLPESGDIATKEYADARLPIGTILNGYTIFDNCIVAFGGVFYRADYPKLWAYLEANPSLVKTEVDWQNENIANGNCGFFSDGNGVTSFRVPYLDKAFLRPDSRGVASYQIDEFKNHAHGLFLSGGVAASGGSSGFLLMGTGTINGNTTFFGGAETRPKNIAVLPLIVAK